MNNIKKVQATLSGVLITYDDDTTLDLQDNYFGHKRGSSGIIEWLEDNTPEPYVEPPEPNATTCSKLQMLDELAERGKEDELFTALDGDVSTKRRWDAANFLEIGHPLVATMGLALGYDGVEMQEVFNAAAKR